MIEDSIPVAHTFLAVMERTIHLVGRNVPRHTLQQVAEVLHALRWDFRDVNVRVYFLVNDAGEVSCHSDWPGPVDSSIAMDAVTFHDAAFGRANLGTALLMGKLRVEGISALKLGRFTSLLKPLLDNYRQACAEINGPAS